MGSRNRRKPMTEKEIEHFRTLLEDKRISIMRDLGLLEEHSMNANSGDASGDLTYSDHMPELGSDAIEREKAYYFAPRDGAYLAQLEEALGRIKAGTFGACRVCGKPIPKARIEAVPTATICVPCKESDQQQRRRSA